MVRGRYVACFRDFDVCSMCMGGGVGDASGGECCKGVVGERWVCGRV